MYKYFSLVKFSHTIFAMPFALIGFILASKTCGFAWISLLYVVLCMVFARSAAMGFNRYIDRDIDKKNTRTANIREIPNGSISAQNALIFVSINSLLFIVTTLQINTLCFFLSPIALIIILGYSYTKRYTALCHLILGLGLALAPIGGYLAVCGEFKLVPILFSVSVLFWVSGFDIIYALQDEQFDKKHKLYSIPVLLGKEKAIKSSKILHIISIINLAFIGVLTVFGTWYWIGLCIFTGLLIYQHYLIKIHDLDKINLAFFTTNGIASIIFGTFVIIEILSQ